MTDRKNQPLPPTPTSPSKEQWGGQEERRRYSWESQGSFQYTAPQPVQNIMRKELPPQPEDTPSASNSPKSSRKASFDEAPAEEYYNASSNGEWPKIITPEPPPRVENMPFRPRVPSQTAQFVDEHPQSRASSFSFARIDEENDRLNNAPVHEQEGLQYHAFDDAPKKPNPRISHVPTPSAGSSSSGGERRVSQLNVPKGASNLPRPLSSISLAAERGRNLSPFGARSAESSPVGHARDVSNPRRVSGRPTSYVNLLNDVPYSQQIAPTGLLGKRSLKSAVGSAASLLDTKKTLDMYRANIKKTTDLAVQYEFAIYMVNCSQEPDIAAELDPAELLNEAKHLLQRLSDKAYPFAQYYLGDGYFSGLFTKGKPDQDKAFPLFVAASKHGHAEAGFRAALCYEFGWGTTKSYPKAVQFYRTSASKNHPGAATRLGLACLNNDMGLIGRDKYREGLKWMKRAQESADYQYNAAPYELGMLHLNGFGDDVFKDEQYAAQLFTQSAELGHLQANFLMGQAYENGLYGCPRDAALSVHFYNGAATAGNPEAMLALTAWYMVGASPVLEKDEREAYEWALKAATTGFAKAEYAVGYFTEMGIGCRRDPLGANYWYVQAADKGNENAKQRLKIIHEAAAGGVQGVRQEKGEDDGKKKKFMGIF